MPMSGRGTDTRMYSPRSESDKMYSSANEDETKYNPASPEYNEQKREEKNRKEEEKKERRSKIKHIKIRAAQKLHDESPEGLDDGNKRDDDREIGLTGGPPGSRGTLLDLATGAKSGTGSAMSGPMPIAMSEPMEDAWSSLLKEDDDVPDMSNFGAPYDPDTRIPELSMDDLWRLRHHPNPRIRHKANEEMDMRSMDAEGSNLPFDTDTTPAGEVAAFYEPQFQDLNFQYGNQQPPDLEDGEYNEEGYDEDYSQERAGDVLEAMPGNIEFFPSLAAKYEHLKNTAPPEVVENYRNRIKDFFDEHTQPSEIFGVTLPPQFTPELPKGTTYTPEEIMQQSDKMNEALHIYPGGNKGYTGFRDDWQNKLASEPMEIAWRLLKNEKPEGMSDEEYYSDLYDDSYDEEDDFEHYNPTEDSDLDEDIKRYKEMINQDFYPDYLVEDASPLSLEQRNNLRRLGMKYYPKKSILKRDTPKSIQRRRREEKRREFRPSTGQFKRPPGGMDPTGATMRRFRARMRGIKSGKKTGLMKPHLSVEMSHRGIATKQPMSKDPQKYTAYRGQSEARKILGNVRTPFSPHGRYGERSNYAGPTGAGRISGLLPGQKGMMRQPSLRQIRVRPPRPPMMPRMPRMPRTPMMPMPQSSVPSMPAPPSSIMMSEDEKSHSDLLKARNIVRHFELLNLMRRLIAAKEKEAKKIKKYVQGGGSAFENGHVPDHPAGVQQHEDEEEKNDGPTQNLETNSSRLGLDPAGVLISRRGHMG